MTPKLLLQGFAILLGLLWLSNIIVNCLNIVFPAPLVGMLLLFLLLHFKVLPLAGIEGICDILISKMGLLFLPAGVSIILYLDLLKREATAFLLIVVIANIIILLTTAKFTDIIISRMGGKK